MVAHEVSGPHGPRAALGHEAPLEADVGAVPGGLGGGHRRRLARRPAHQQRRQQQQGPAAGTPPPDGRRPRHGGLRAGQPQGALGREGGSGGRPPRPAPPRPARSSSRRCKLANVDEALPPWGRGRSSLGAGSPHPRGGAAPFGSGAARAQPPPPRAGGGWGGRRDVAPSPGRPPGPFLPPPPQMRASCREPRWRPWDGAKARPRSPASGLFVTALAPRRTYSVQGCECL